MLWSNRALVRSQQPSLEQGGHPMHPWQQFCRCTFLQALEFAHLVLIAKLIQPLVWLPTVRMHTTPLDNCTLDESMEFSGRSVWNSSHTDAPNAGTHLLGGNHHQRFTRNTASFLSWRDPAH